MQSLNVQCSEIALLLGMIAHKLCEKSIVYTFDTKIRQFFLPKECGILHSAIHIPITGGGTNMSRPFVEMIDKNIKADRIIILSDNMCNSGISYHTRFPVQKLADGYRKATGCDIWVHAIDLQGYGTQQFYGKKTNIIAGWSEKVFDFITLAEKGKNTLFQEISQYEW